MRDEGRERRTGDAAEVTAESIADFRLEIADLSGIFFNLISAI
jgi:hypothetical protein